VGNKTEPFLPHLVASSSDPFLDLDSVRGTSEASGMPSLSDCYFTPSQVLRVVALFLSAVQFSKLFLTLEVRELYSEKTR